MIDAIYVVRKPLLSEKSTALAEQHQYAFEVDLNARKPEIKQAVEALYGVRVTKVNTSIHQDRNRRTRWGISGGKKTKKAIVTLHADDSIELF